MTPFCFQRPSRPNRRARTFASLCDAGRMQGASWIKVELKRKLHEGLNICLQHGGTDLREPRGTLRCSTPARCQCQEYQVSTWRNRKLKFLKRFCLETNWKVYNRNIFGRMSMNDSETVALIGEHNSTVCSVEGWKVEGDQKFSHQCQGGGHAFGKAHGACKTGMFWKLICVL